MENIAQKNLVRRYLLGALSDAEQLTLEQKYFADGETFEQVWALENELVDAYVRDQLTRQERELFERNYLSTLRHQQRVAVARSLVQAADEIIVEEKAEQAKPTTSWWANFLSLLQMPQLAWGAAAALLLLTLAGYWYSRSNNSFQDQLARNRPDVPSIAPTTATAPTPIVTPGTPPSATPNAEQTKPAPPLAPTTQPAVPAVLALVLGGGLRKPGDVQPLTVPVGTKQVRLQIKLESDEYPSYQLKLRSAAGKEVLNQSALHASPNKKSVVVMVPAGKLAQGDYILTLSGLTSANETEEIKQYFFRIIPK